MASDAITTQCRHHLRKVLGSSVDDPSVSYICPGPLCDHDLLPLPWSRLPVFVRRQQGRGADGRQRCHGVCMCMCPRNRKLHAHSRPVDIFMYPLLARAPLSMACATTFVGASLAPIVQTTPTPPRSLTHTHIRTFKIPPFTQRIGDGNPIAWLLPVGSRFK